MGKLRINLSKLINLNKFRDDVNLFLFENNLGGINELQKINKIIGVLKNVQVEIYNV